MADIGEKLCSAREAKGLSIADIEKATKIQSRYLTAIEQDEFDKLPGDFYVRAFIRQYAQVVGLDGKELLSEYHQDIPKAEPDEYVEDSIDNKSEEVRKTTDNKKKIWQDYLPRIIIGLGVVVVILVCYVVYAHFSSNKQTDTTDNDVAVSSTNNAKPKKKKRAKRNSVKIKEIATNQFQVTGLKKDRNLVVRAGQQSVTVTITIDGANQGSQTLVADQKRTLELSPSANNVVVTLSNAADATITIGGKKVPFTKQEGSMSLTFILGKSRQSKPSQSNDTNNNYQHNNTTDSNQHQTNRNNRQQNQTQSQNQPAHNNQSNQQQGQTGQQNNNQTNNTEHSNQNSGTNGTNNSSTTNNENGNN
ncbi:helix-turn-helix domain-containing protein [Lactobacillus sp. ESL0681]|uniref:helix-turn-helix domain-containing protein n=1 Tax=Lactobacillus sp. ESL0681 TaxID=2983211 RepID=UPI0023F74CB7|nr:helix-turn-helix domain-containing protein [Lactobacillus sp. ESL0681]WEV40424.1 helix-turn-helix domain-containing protein [Lactobacillus sp. ESL0681]